jgi:hypothetical protein
MDIFNMILSGIFYIFDQKSVDRHKFVVFPFFVCCRHDFDHSILDYSQAEYRSGSNGVEGN